MNVLIVSFYYYPELGAAPSRITNLASGLKNDGVKVDVLTCLPNYPKGQIFRSYRNKVYCTETIDGISIFRYWTYASISKSALSRVLSMTSFAALMWSFSFQKRRIRQYDVVIVQSPPILVSWSAVLLFKSIYHKKVILNISDLWPLSAVELGAITKDSIFHKVLKGIERSLYKKADGVMGQSAEILEHVRTFIPLKRCFLYRNLQHAVPIPIAYFSKDRSEKFRIVYAGLLGVAQNVLDLIQSVNFKELDVEFHIYGGGNQADKIEAYLSSNDVNVYYHGYLEKKEMVETLVQFDASIVPLAVRIKGAVPSKIFDLLPVGIPILFCGGGEGADIVSQNRFGFVSEPGNYDQLKYNIRYLKSLPQKEYREIVDNCLMASRNEFDFGKQMKHFQSYINEIIKL